MIQFISKLTLKVNLVANLEPFWASVNPQAKILLQKMLIIDDLNRISAKQALKSIWF